MAHPLRFRLLTLLNQGVASPSDLATRLEEPLGNVAYHVRCLADLGCVELVDTKPVRGTLEHYYRATMRPHLSDEDWDALPISVRRSIVGDVLERAWQDVTASSKARHLDRPDIHISRTDFELDEQGIADVNELMTRTLERAMDIQAESAGRSVAAGEQGEGLERTKLVLLHFPAASAAEAKAAKAAKGGAKRR